MTTPLNNLTDTWNNGATVFTGLKYNITNTASAAGSKLFDFQISSVSKINGDKDGTVYAKAFSSIDQTNTPSLQFAANTISFQPQGIGNGQFYSMSDSSFGFQYSSLSLNWAGQTFLWGNVEGNNSLSLRNGVSANRFLVYNTFTDASNYERGVFDWTTNVNQLTIGTQQLGTGTARPIIITSGSNISVVATASLFIGMGGKSAAFQTAGGQGILYTDQLGLDYNNGDTILARGAAGIFKFASAGSFTANNTTATVLGSLGPAGASTTVTKWLTIKDDGGTTRYIPCF